MNYLIIYAHGLFHVLVAYDHTYNNYQIKFHIAYVKNLNT